MSNLWSPRLRDEARRADFWPTNRATPAPDAIPNDGDAFACGLEEGRRTVEVELAGEREALLQMVESCAALAMPDSGRLAHLMIATVERLVHDIAGATPIDAELLRERAEALALHVASDAAPVMLVHPDDAALIDTDRVAVPVEADVSLARGTLRVRAGDVQFEDGVDAALARLRAQMNAMGVAS